MHHPFHFRVCKKVPVRIKILSVRGEVKKQIWIKVSSGVGCGCGGVGGQGVGGVWWSLEMRCGTGEAITKLLEFNPLHT